MTEYLNEMCNCMTFIAGKNITRSHYVMVGHNEDDGGLNFARRGFVPARDWAEGSVLPAEPGCASIPQVAHTYGYYWVESKNAKGGLLTADAFTNENGVVITSNSMVCSKEDGKDASIVRDGGIGYNLRRILAERSRSARDGARILTELIQTWGYSDSGRAYTIADKDEAFMFQLVRGRHYLGARVPDDALVVMPNHYDFHTLSDCAEMFYPDDIITYAIEKGWYVPAREGDYSDFDFAKAYQREDLWRNPVNTLRQKYSTRLLLNRDWDEEEPYPFAVYPDRELGVEDFARALRTHYEDTPDERSGIGPGRAPHADPDCRCVCTHSTLESIIWVLDARPERITAFTALGRPCQLPYLPLHPLCALPTCLLESDDLAERMERHLLPEPEIASYRDTVWRRFRDFDCRGELVYADEHDAVRQLLDEQLREALTMNALAQTWEPEAVSARDGAYIERCLTRLWETAKPSPVRVEAVSDKAADTVTVIFESAVEPTETEMIFGIDMTSIHSEYAHIQEGSLRRMDGDRYQAVFSTEPFRKFIEKGKQVFWLGGRTADERAFAALTII